MSLYESKQSKENIKICCTWIRKKEEWREYREIWLDIPICEIFEAYFLHTTPTAWKRRPRFAPSPVVPGSLQLWPCPNTIGAHGALGLRVAANDHSMAISMIHFDSFWFNDQRYWNTRSVKNSSFSSSIRRWSLFTSSPPRLKAFKAGSCISSKKLKSSINLCRISKNSKAT